jgi:hypothetical protein
VFQRAVQNDQMFIGDLFQIHDSYTPFPKKSYLRWPQKF